MTQDEIIRMAREAGLGEPVNHDQWDADLPRLERFAALVAAHEREKQAEQEPVLWQSTILPTSVSLVGINNDEWRPLYAAPVRTKDLTDDEIYTLYSEPCSDREMVEFARAVIAAYKEKNNANNNT